MPQSSIATKYQKVIKENNNLILIIKYKYKFGIISGIEKKRGKCHVMAVQTKEDVGVASCQNNLVFH